MHVCITICVFEVYCVCIFKLARLGRTETGRWWPPTGTPGACAGPEPTKPPRSPLAILAQSF